MNQLLTLETFHICNRAARCIYIYIFSNIEVSFFKGICNIASLVNTVILYIAILSANLAIFVESVIKPVVFYNYHSKIA